MNWHRLTSPYRSASLLITALSLCVVINGCTLDQSQFTDNGVIYPIRAVATVGMVADIVREVGGPYVTVTQLMGPGVDPHLYKGTRDDVRSILNADIVFYSGLMLEGKLTDMLEKVAKKKPVVAVTKDLPEGLVLAEDELGAHTDPHVWMDASIWGKCVDAVTIALAKQDPSNEAVYFEAAKTYQEKLAKLHSYGKEVIESVPPKGRVLITSHDAFAYFGRAYGLEVYGVQGLATDSEAGLRQINALVDTIVERDIAAVFVESSVPQKSILAVVDGAGSRGQSVIVGGELYSDAMGERGTYEGTYIGMLDHNLTIVANALGGVAPLKGMQGMLSNVSETVLERPLSACSPSSQMNADASLESTRTTTFSKTKT